MSAHRSYRLRKRPFLSSLGDQNMDVQQRKLSDIRPYDRNPRKNGDAVGPVARSIQEFGFKVPLVVDRDGVVVCGHTRLLAAEQLGLKEVPVVIADDLTPEQIK